MIMKKVGFSLIECMIYCMVMAITMAFWFHGIAIFNRLCKHQTKEINLLSSVYSTFDVFVRDLRIAPYDSNLWPLRTHSSFIFKYNASTYIGWEYKDAAMVRYQGSYDCRTHTWLKKTKSLVLTTVQDCSFISSDLDTHIKTMTIAIKLQDKQYERLVHIQPSCKEQA
jgi:hypothetical protein